jgi:hypothetical protein
MRARQSTLRSTSSPTSSQPRDTNPPSTGVPPSPAGRHASGAASVGPAAARTRPVRMLHAHAHEAARARAMSAPAPARVRRLRARRGATPLALATGTCERARRLACFADGLRVASPVQAAAAACGRTRRPPRPRHLRHDQQARHRHHGHEDPAAVMPAGSPLGPGGARPVPVPVCRARSSSRLRPRRRAARPAHHRERPRRLRPGHRRHDGHSKHHRGLHAGAASCNGSTTSPPLARRQPTLTRVALPCIHTAHTTHSRHRLPLVARFHSTTRAQLTRFSCLRAALARQDLLVAHRGRRDPWFVLPAS